VEAIATQVLIINEGRIAAQGRPEEIARTMKGADTWEMTIKGNADAVREKLSLLDGFSGSAPEVSDNAVRLNLFAPSHIPSEAAGEMIFDWAVSQGFKITGMVRKKLSIEDIFVKLTAEAQEGVSKESDNAGDAK
jgi:ABC-2 type transport system ATP-binding protein